MRDAFINLLFPPACLLCHHTMPDGHEPLCAGCRRAMFRCGPVRRIGPLAFASAHAPFLFSGAAREAMHAFKYHGRHRIGCWFAEEMAAAAARSLPLDTIACVVPVPPHWAKRLIKGFDPTAQLAHTLARRINRPCAPLLRRRRWTPTQTRLTRAKRFRNVRGAFEAGEIGRVSPSSPAVLLVDDVLTSGATAHAGARALRRAGVGAVHVLTAACAPESA